MTPNPPGRPRVGTTVHEGGVKKFGSTYVTDSTVTAVGPGSYRFSGAGDIGRVAGGRSVTDDDNGQAVFKYDIVLHLEGMNGFISPLIRLLLARGLRHDVAVMSGRIGSDMEEARRV